MGGMADAPPTPAAPAATPAVRTDGVWIVIPLYNEATVIGGVVAELLESFTHVVCVDDGSTDGSAAVAEAAGARVIRHPHNLGQGAALQTGISYARAQAGCTYVVTFDADGQHRVIDALAMIELARTEDAAIVFGSRFLDDRTKPGLAKKIVLKTAVAVTNLSTGLTLTDAHNGLRVLRVDAAHAVNLKQDRMAHASEIVVQLGRSGLPWREFPVEVLYTDYSKAKGQSLLNSINILVDLIIN
jgi:glycosyltransferase involved in cell wall biosynthesis